MMKKLRIFLPILMASTVGLLLFMVRKPKDGFYHEMLRLSDQLKEEAGCMHTAALKMQKLCDLLEWVKRALIKEPKNKQLSSHNFSWGSIFFQPSYELLYDIMHDHQGIDQSDAVISKIMRQVDAIYDECSDTRCAYYNADGAYLAALWRDNMYALMHHSQLLEASGMNKQNPPKKMAMLHPSVSEYKQVSSPSTYGHGWNHHADQHDNTGYTNDNAPHTRTEYVPVSVATSSPRPKHHEAVPSRLAHDKQKNELSRDNKNQSPESTQRYFSLPSDEKSKNASPSLFSAKNNDVSSRPYAAHMPEALKNKSLPDHVKEKMIKHDKALDEKIEKAQKKIHEEIERDFEEWKQKLLE